MEQNKAQYKCQNVKIQNANKYEFITGKDVLPEKGLLKKAATIKRFEYSRLSKTDFKKQTDIIKMKEDKIKNLFETIIKTDENYNDKIANDLLYLPKREV